MEATDHGQLIAQVMTTLRIQDATMARVDPATAEMARPEALEEFPPDRLSEPLLAGFPRGGVRHRPTSTARSRYGARCRLMKQITTAELGPPMRWCPYLLVPRSILSQRLRWRWAMGSRTGRIHA